MATALVLMVEGLERQELAKSTSEAARMALDHLVAGTGSVVGIESNGVRVFNAMAYPTVGALADALGVLGGVESPSSALRALLAEPPAEAPIQDSEPVEEVNPVHAAYQFWDREGE